MVETTFFLVPVDQISGEFEINDYSSWKHQFFDRTKKEFGETYGEVTGTLLFKSETEKNNCRESSLNLEYWKLTRKIIKCKITGEERYFVKVTGNPSRIFHGGKNYGNVSLEAFKVIIEKLSFQLGVSLNIIKITAPFEVSLTIAPPVRVSEEDLKGRLMAFRDREFERLKNNKGNFMGCGAEGSHYDVKIYLPSIKFHEPLNSLRIERKYKKIPYLKRRTGIENFADLLDADRLGLLYDLIEDTWDDVVIFDPSLRRSKKREPYMNEIISNGGCQDFWLKKLPNTATDKTIKKRIKEYNVLSSETGAGLHLQVAKCIKNEANKIRNCPTWVCETISEIDKNVDCIKVEVIKNESKNMSGIKQNSKSKKQLNEEKREKDEAIRKSFYIKLGETLRKIEGELKINS